MALSQAIRVQGPAVEAEHEAKAARSAVRLERLWKTYPGTSAPAVRDLSLDVKDGEVFTLLGPSGCGKSTTLRMVAGLEEPDAGSIFFGDRTIVAMERGMILPPYKRDLGMVFQSYAIWPHMTVEANVAFPLKIKGVNRSEIKERVYNALELVGMKGLEKRPAPLLSGGQQQRVALARAIVNEPSVLLLDEPFSNLDAKLREQMRVEVKLLQKRLNIAVIFVTHDQIEALSLSNRVALMDHGVVQQMGHPRELYEHPSNAFVRDFVGKTALFRGRIQISNPSGQVAVAIEGAPDCVLFGRVIDPDALDTDKPVYIGIRPEDVEIERAGTGAPPAGAISAKVLTALFTGERMEYQVEAQGQMTFLCYGDRRDALEDGARAWLRPRPDGHSVWPSDWSQSEFD